MRFLAILTLLAPIFASPRDSWAGDGKPRDAIASDRDRSIPAIIPAESDRSPIALSLSADGTKLVTANQTSNSVALVDLAAGRVLDEIVTGEKPAGIAITRDGTIAVVTHWYGYDLAMIRIEADRMKIAGRVKIGAEPRGVVLSPDGKTAYAAVGAANEVVRIDLPTLATTGRLIVGREPRGIAISADGATILVGNSRSRNVSLINTSDFQVTRTIPIDGDNLRQAAIDKEGKFAYIAGMKNRGFATVSNHIDLGWVLGQRLTRVSLVDDSPFDTLSLDPRGKATADAHGVAIGGDGRLLAVSCGGTHEVLLFRTDLGDLPWRTGNSRDLIPQELLKNDGRFRRVELGGRPTELAFAPDHKTLYVANYLNNSIQIVDCEKAELARTIELGGPSEPSLVRRGEILFHEARRSFNQWYSCNTCHSDGHTDGLDFDTLNDGYQDLSTSHLKSRKKVPTLRRVSFTAPWTWHGWQKSLEQATVESFTKSMRGPAPSAEEAKAVVAYLGSLDYPPNPYRELDGSLSDAAKRGESIFRSAKAACATCHKGPEFTDGKIHIVGLEEPYDVYRGFNTPSLRGVYDKDPYLHDGRSATLREMLKGPHGPETVSGGEPLSDSEIADLIAYLKTL